MATSYIYAVRGFEFDSDKEAQLCAARYGNPDNRPYIKRIPVVTCSCGEKVQCRHFTNTCTCGVDYNFNGSRLAPRSQWGEETGEHWTECI